MEMASLTCSAPDGGLVRPGPVGRTFRNLLGIGTLGAAVYAALAVEEWDAAALPLAAGILLFFGLDRLRIWSVPYVGFGLLPVWLAILIGFPGTVAANILLPSSFFLGLSFLIAGLKGYAGCEITAIPNLFRRTPVEHGCAALWDTIDRWEAGKRRTT